MSSLDKLFNQYSHLHNPEENTVDVDKLLKCLDNDKHEDIFHLTSSKIKQIKNKVLQQLGLPGDELKKFHKKLEEYRYVDDLVDLKEGSYIRWIPIKDIDNVKLTNGGILLEIKLYNNGIQLLCKNKMNRVFQIKMDNVLIFQKLSDQEKILITIIDNLKK